MDGIELLEQLREKEVEAPVIMISGHGNIETAVDCIKKGAFDFIEKPIDLSRLLVTVRNALEKNNLVTETKTLKKKVAKKLQMIGNSPSIEKVREMIRKVAPTDARVLLQVLTEPARKWLHDCFTNTATGFRDLTWK